MPAEKTIHWNPPTAYEVRFRQKTRCGLKLEKVEWRHDINDTTCNKCKKWGALK